MDVNTLCMRCMNGSIRFGKCTSCHGGVLTKQSAAHALPLRTILHGRYLVGGVLGFGGFGITYAAYDLEKNVRAAIKEYMPIDGAVRHSGGLMVTAVMKDAWYDKGKQRFLEEAKMIYRYRNIPDIIQVRHLFEENKTAYYVMEFLEGRDLARLLEEHKNVLPWQDLKPYIETVIRALALVHKDGVIHRDISPDNIYITKENRAKLIDFGAARQYVANESKSVVLKRGYAPPEQYLSNGHQGPWTDIYALSGTIYHCITGIRPQEASERVIKDRLKSPGELGIAIPSSTEAALMKGLKLNIRERYEDIEEYAAALFGYSLRQKNIYLIGVEGVYGGSQIRLENELVMGRDLRCGLIFPEYEPGISRNHCHLLVEKGELYLTDLYSTYGTYINRQRAEPGRWYHLSEADEILLGKNNRFRIRLGG